MPFLDPSKGLRLGPVAVCDALFRLRTGYIDHSQKVGLHHGHNHQNAPKRSTIYIYITDILTLRGPINKADKSCASRTLPGSLSFALSKKVMQLDGEGVDLVIEVVSDSYEPGDPQASPSR